MSAALFHGCKRRLTFARSLAKPITEVDLVSECILEDWPAKQEGDVGYVYVALTGDGFCEAVTVTLTREADTIRIRELEWGRP